MWGLGELPAAAVAEWINEDAEARLAAEHGDAFRAFIAINGCHDMEPLSTSRSLGFRPLLRPVSSAIGRS